MSEKIRREGDILFIGSRKFYGPQVGPLAFEVAEAAHALGVAEERERWEKGGTGGDPHPRCITAEATIEGAFKCPLPDVLRINHAMYRRVDPDHPTSFVKVEKPAKPTTTPWQPPTKAETRENHRKWNSHWAAMVRFGSYWCNAFAAPDDIRAALDTPNDARALQLALERSRDDG